MIEHRRGRRVATAAIALGLVIAPAACGSGDDTSDTAAGPSPTVDPGDAGLPDPGSPTSDAPVECTGEALEFGAIFPQSGPGSVLFTGIEGSIRAAEAAINAECELGRPIEIDTCDDESDPNGAAACGRKLADEGAIALVGELGAFDEGPEAAQLPVFAEHGGSGYVLTSPLSFPPTASLTFAYGFPNAFKAAGASDMIWVAADLPSSQFDATLMEPNARSIGLGFSTLFFPPDTTDDATVAAQISSKEPTGIVIASQQPGPIIRALNAEGITAENTVMISATPLGDDQIADLGELAEGIYQTAATYPYSATDNEGVAQMHEELEAADQDDSEINTLGVASWSQVHSMADALAKLSPAELDALTGNEQAFVDAIVAASPYQRPEMAPYDFSKPAWTIDQNPILGQFRSFSRSGLLLRVEGGKYEVATDGFVDFSTSFELKAG